MDLNCLPDEMLTIILKKTEFAECLKLRKMNRRIDNLAKRAKISAQIPVRLIEFWPSEIIFEWKDSLVDLQNGEDDYKVTKFKWNNLLSHTEQLKEWISKVQIRRRLLIAGHCKTEKPNGGIILDETDDILEVLLNLKSHWKNVKEIDFYKCNFDRSFNTVIELISNVCPQLKSLGIISCQELIGTQCFKMKVPPTRILNKCTILNNNSHKDKFLLDMASTSKELYIGLNNNVTLNGIKNMLKKCISENNFSQSINLLSPIAFPAEDIALFGESLQSELPGIEINVEGNVQKYYTITYKTKEKVTTLCVSLYSTRHQE